MPRILDRRVLTTRPRRGASLACALAAALTAFAAGCHDSTAPGDGGPLGGGREVSGSLSESDSVDRYTIRADSGDEVVISLEAVSGRFVVSLVRAGEQGLPRSLAVGVAASDGSTASPRIARLAPLVADGTYWLEVRPTAQQPAAATGQYRLAWWTRDRRPEHAAARIALGDTVAGESFDRPLDVDEFTFHGEQGQIVEAYAQPLDTSLQVRMQLLIWREGADPGPFGLFALGTVVSVGGVRGMEDQASGRIVLPATGEYRVSVTESVLGQSDAPYVGGYRFRVATVDPRPEHAPARLVPGDTVSTEQLDAIGDVDEFTFTGEAGQQFAVYFQTLVDGLDLMRLTVVGVGGSPGADLLAPRAGPGVPLRSRSTGRFTLPSSGTYTVRVTGESDRTGGARGGYRLALYAIDPRPERVPAATLAPGDSVLGEALDAPGDVDEFTLTVAQPTRVNVTLWRVGAPAPGAPSDALALALVRPSGAVTALASVGAAVQGAGSGVMLLDPGTYRLRVTSDGTRPSAVPYMLQVSVPPGEAPERAPAAVAVGTTVDEALDALGDEDVFTFSGRRGEHLDLLVRGPGGTADAGGFTFTVTGTSAAYRGPVAAVAAPLGSAELGQYRTGRFTLPATGSYEIRVAATGQGRVVSERGAYRFSLVAAPTGVETGPAELAVGATITTERIDAAGDVDEFTLRGTPGSDALVTVAGPLPGATTSAIPVRVDVLDPATRLPLPVAYFYGFAGYNDANARLTMPASGSVLLQVYQPLPCVPAIEFCAATTGPAVVTSAPYSLRAQAINRAPESVSASIAVGDTVRGESIGVIGDLDEFTLAGTAGQRVVVYFSTSGSTFGALRLELIEPGTGAVLGSLSVQDAQPLGAHATGTITLPTTGNYLVRVDAASLAQAGYQFLVKAVP